MRHSYLNKYLVLIADMAIFTSAAMLAWALRVGAEHANQNYQMLFPYLLVSMSVSLVVFRVLRLHRHFFRFFSFYEVAHIAAATAIAILVTVLISFSIFRLEDVQRSLPFLHGVFAFLGFLALRLIGMTIGIRRENQIVRKKNQGRVATLIIGFNPVADTCLRALPVVDDKDFFVAGILDENPQRHGSRMRQCEVIGHPANLERVLAQMSVHGVEIHKIILCTNLDSLSSASQNTIDRLVADGRIEVLDFKQHLNDLFTFSDASPAQEIVAIPDQVAVPPDVQDQADRAVARNAWIKRLLDILLASVLILLLLPVLLLVAPLIAMTMGSPVFFWQERPGRNGRIIRLFKLRTMKHGVSDQNQVLPDAERQTYLGTILRRFRLDELPQLFNVLIGDMSFVGPRPLLPIDLPVNLPGWVKLRTMVRPGLTGWAQVNGGQEVKMEDKVIMDAWYITRMSLWNDLRIIFLTIMVVVKGEKLDRENIRTSYKDLGLEIPEQAGKVARYM